MPSDTIPKVEQVSIAVTLESSILEVPNSDLGRDTDPQNLLVGFCNRFRRIWPRSLPSRPFDAASGGASRPPSAH
jgi:hypothetical protein